MSTNPEARPALTFDPSVSLRFLLQAIPFWNEYREECVKLLHEAKRALESGCPTASAIASGEALMRALCDRALYCLPDANCPENWRAIVANAGNYGLLDVCFKDLIDAFGQRRSYDPRTIQQMDDVRCLRNAAVHRAAPLVDQWDPDDPREDIRPALQAGFEWPEGYRIYLNLVKLDRNGKPRTAAKPNTQTGGNGNTVDESRWVYFDCRTYDCTLRHLDAPSRIAAIMFYLVLDILKTISSGPLVRPSGDDAERQAYRELLTPELLARDKAIVTSSTYAETRTLIVSSRECGYFPTIAEALREAHSRDRIEVRAGFYREHLALAKSVAIVGSDEKEDVIIQADGDYCLSVRAEDVSIRDLTLLGTSTGSYEECRTIEHVSGTLHMENCDVQSFRGTCMTIAGAGSTVHARNCTFHGGSHGVIFDAGAHGTLEDSTIQDTHTGI